MKTLIKSLFSVAALSLSAATLAAGGGQFLPHDPVNIDATDKQSLQRGAKYFVNYCLGCHSMKYQRYKRLADDAEMPVEIVANNLMFTGENIHDQMRINMPDEDAAKWFGTAPPDLSLVARSRSPEWIYNYLRAFYKDDERPWGVNNTVFPSVGMPHVMVGLQGLQEKSKKYQAVEARIAAAEQAKNKAIAEGDSKAKSQAATDLHFAKIDQMELIENGEMFTIVKPGEMTVEEYDNMARDMANFMAYVADPVKTKRETLGIYVMIFLVILGLFAYAMKKEFWRDIH